MPAKRTPAAAQAPAPAPYRWALPVARLKRAAPQPVDLRPEAAEREAIAAFLGLLGLDALRFKGALHPVGADAWRAEGRLTAQATQACVVTLAPVVQVIDEPVTRDLLPAETLTAPAELDLDLDADDPDTFETEIDLGALTVEALALALDPYPRADGAEHQPQDFAPPGAEPLTEADLNPFAKLRALKEKLAGGET